MGVVIVGVAGGSASGKTTFIKELHDSLGPQVATILYQDNYYNDMSDRFDHDGGAVNFDHPDAIDFDLLAVHIGLLKKGEAIEVPHYDFKTHSRLAQRTPLKPTPVILLDGILILSQAKILKQLDHKLYVTCPESIRLERRIARDVSERGRTEEGVITQFNNHVKPMHDLYVNPSKEKACDVISLESFSVKLEHWFKIISAKALLP